MSPTSTRLESLPALPSPQLVDAKADPAAAILALVEPASRWLAQASTIADVAEVRARASALDTYARAKGLADEAVRSARTIELRASMALGRLMPEQKRGPGAGRNCLPGDNQFRPDERSRLRQLAEHAEVVEEAIASAPTDKLSARQVLARVERQRRQHVDETARTITPAKGSKAKAGERWSMVRGDTAKELAKMPAGSVDAIVTDPPYPKESLALWSVLAEQATRVLVPDGLLIALTGQILLADVMAPLGEHLTYGWTYCQPMTAQSRIRGRNVYQSWKPWLVYTTGTWPSGRIDWHRDVLDVVPVEKDDYRWQQTVRPAEQLISTLVPRNGLVLDPFAGTGSYGIAALGAGCRFVGIEADADRFRTATERLEQAT